MFIEFHGVFMDFSEFLMRKFVLFYFVGVIWIIRWQRNIIYNIITIFSASAESCNKFEIKVRSLSSMVYKLFHGAQIFVNIITPRELNWLIIVYELDVEIWIKAL